jgi:transposase InsO family protein
MRQIYTLVNLERYALRTMKYLSTMRPKYLSNQEVCDFRMKVLIHAQTYGTASALDAFNISRSTFYNWQKAFKEGGKLIVSLAPASTRPHRLRTPSPHPWHENQICILRQQHHGLGKEKIKVLLDALCLKNKQALLSESTIGRIITRLKKRGAVDNPCKLRIDGHTGRLRVKEVKRQKALARRKDYLPKEPGDLLQMDSVTMMADGLRRYIVSAIDYRSSMAYSYAYKTLSSLSAKDFLGKLLQIVPFEIKHIQTDNGGEFHKYFQKAVQESEIKQFWNYPRTPKANGKIERYNRTIQKDFAEWHIDTIIDDVGEFNRHLTEWLIFYNTIRPHHAVRIDGKQAAPLKGCLKMMGFTDQESNMCWTYTYH